MSVHRWTPGPWQYAENTADSIFAHSYEVRTIGKPLDGERVICRLPTGFAYPERGNAMLIAAAPDLYAACEAALQSLDARLDDTGIDQVRQILRTALAKAAP